MAVKYNSDIDYARDKLVGSFIAHKGEIVCVVEVSSHEKVFLRTVEDKTISAALEELNLEPPRLGYVNIGNECYFVSRIPARHYRQGFRANTTRLINSRWGIRGGINPTPEYTLALKGIYPTLDSCVESVVNEEALSKAFSRPFGIYRNKSKISIEYKGRKVGDVNDKNSELILDNKFLFLGEVLEQCL